MHELPPKEHLEKPAFVREVNSAHKVHEAPTVNHHRAHQGDSVMIVKALKTIEEADPNHRPEDSRRAATVKAFTEMIRDDRLKLQACRAQLEKVSIFNDKAARVILLKIYALEDSIEQNKKMVINISSGKIAV